MNIRKIQNYWQDSGLVDTTPDGKQVIGIIGDSNADGRGTTIPTVAGETLFLWNSTGGTVDEITTESVANNGAGIYGSIWQQYATDRKANQSLKTVLVNGANGGAEFYPNGDDNNWYTSGDLYADFQTKMNNCLSVLGLSTPKYIIVNLGINDLRAGTSFADITTGVNSLVSRLLSDYPGVPIRFVQVGRSESLGNATDFYKLRRLLRDVAEDNANCHLVSNAACFIGVSGGYEADNLHYSQATNNTMGTQMSLWETNLPVYSKWPSAVLSMFFDDLSTLRKGLVAGWVDGQIASGNYFDQFEQFTNMVSTVANNVNIDWAFLGYSLNVDCVFNANANLQAANQGQSFAFGFVPSFYTSNANYQDIITGIKVINNASGAGATRVLYGRTDGTNIIRTAQNASFTNYYVNALSTNGHATTDTTWPNNTLISISSNGTNKSYIKNKTTLQTNTVVPSAGCTLNMRLNPQEGFNGLVGTFGYQYAAKFDGFDLDSFYDDTEYMQSHWND